MPGAEDLHFSSMKNKTQGDKTRPQEKTRPTNTYSAKAVRAYQTMATHAQHNPPADEPEAPKDNAPTANKLASKEIRDIHQLIIDLEILEKRGVATLHILKASSFVESLKQAITKKIQTFKK